MVIVKSSLFFAEDLSQFLAPTWQLTNSCNSSSKGSDSLFWLPKTPGTQVMHKHSGRQSTHRHFLKKKERKKQLEGTGGLQNRSVFKNTGCWVHFLVSTQQLTTRFYSSRSRGSGILFWHLKATGTQVVYRHSHRQSTHTDNTKYFSIKFKNRIENHGPTLSEERIWMLKLPRRMVGNETDFK